MARVWLLLLCVVLMVWQPLSFAVEASSSLGTLGMRGAAGAVELVVHGAVAALAVAAGWALWQSSPGGPKLARVAIVAAALVSVQSLYATALPSNVFPSDRLPLAALNVTAAAGWLAYLWRSARIRAIEDPEPATSSTRLSR
ncbi:MAG: hypothetical protein ABI211_29700 [Vicinamibacterales bacterium]